MTVLIGGRRLHRENRLSSSNKVTSIKKEARLIKTPKTSRKIREIDQGTGGQQSQLLLSLVDGVSFTGVQCYGSRNDYDR